MTEINDSLLLGRTPLSGDIILIDKSNNHCIFNVSGTVSAGASCVCYSAAKYDAAHNLLHKGLLKEFYPYNIEGITRYPCFNGDASGQLCVSAESSSIFKKDRDSFHSSINQIYELKSKNSELDKFFAYNELYKSAGDSDTFTYYIWYPEDRTLVSFEDHLRSMHKSVKDTVKESRSDLDSYLARQLLIVLSSIRAMALGVGKLHSNKMYHLDIKPSNFGIRMLDSGSTGISVSLFDVDSICSADTLSMRTAGSRGFRAPELVHNLKPIHLHCFSKISRKTDIFSLGATLYNSIILADSGREVYLGGENEGDQFENISKSLASSLLIKSSEINSKADLLDVLSRILSRSLLRTTEDNEKVQSIMGSIYGNVCHYESIDQFIGDVERAEGIIRLQLTDVESDVMGMKIVSSMVDKEKYYADSVNTGALGAIQRLLYEHPLYNYTDTKGQLEMLVLGCGVYSQKMIDLSLELAQVKKCYIHVTVMTNNVRGDRERYLSSRPELCNYFTVDGKKAALFSSPDGENGTEDYGSIDCCNVDDLNPEISTRGFADNLNNVEIIKRVLGSNRKKFSYVFISFSNDHLNMSVAKSIYGSTLTSKRSIVNYIRYAPDPDENELTVSETGNCILNPVCIRDTLADHPDYRLLKRLAFNCHLLWEKRIATDMSYAESQFSTAYNFNSSLANALSAKYKLHNAGIDLDEITSQPAEKMGKAIGAVTKKLRTKLGIGNGGSDLMDELTAYEHRRWVVNTICQSFCSIPPEKYHTLENDNKDRVNLLHTCLAPSRKSPDLSRGVWLDTETWDRSDIEELDCFKSLDPLDKMSVRLHRMFMGRAAEFTMESIEEDASAIKRTLKDYPDVLAVFNVFLVSMRTVMKVKTRNSPLLENYNYCSSRFKSCFGGIRAESVRSEVADRYKRITDAFAPVKLAYEYTDFKAKDQTLIRNLPFMLNYTQDIRLGIPFEVNGSGSAWFDAIAPSLILNPAAVTFLICNDVPPREESGGGHPLGDTVDSLCKELAKAFRIMDSHSLRTKADVVICHCDDVSEKEKQLLRERLSAISPRVTSAELLYAAPKELASRVGMLIRTIQGSSSPLSAIRANDTPMSRIISSVKKKDADLSLPAFTFDCISRSFKAESKCDECLWLEDMPFESSLNVEDLFSASDKSGIYFEPEMDDCYEDIWNNCYYDEDKEARALKSSAWRALCNILSKHDRSESHLGTLPLPEDTGSKIHTLLVPAFCRPAAALMADEYCRASQGVMKVSALNSQLAKIEISDHDTLVTMERIFRNPYLLSDPNRIKLLTTAYGISVDSDSLLLSNVCPESLLADTKWANGYPELHEGIRKTLEYLRDNGYIIINDATVHGAFSITFASHFIKELLTDEDRILETYTYYKAVESARYDQVKMGVRIKGTDASAADRIDLITVKGFESSFTEIAHGDNLTEDVISRLRQVGNDYGINAALSIVSTPDGQSVDNDGTAPILLFGSPEGI